MAKQTRFVCVRDGILDHHPEMTWAEIAVFSNLLSRADRTDRNGRVGLCPGLTGNKLANAMKKSRGATHRALAGLAGVTGPNGKRARYIEVLREGILVLNFAAGQQKRKTAILDASGIGRIPPGQNPATRPESSHPPGQNLATTRPEYSRIRPDSSQASLLRDVNVSEDEDLDGVAVPAGTESDEEFSLTSEVESPPQVIGPVSWDSEKDELSIDEEWLRSEIEGYQVDVGVVLTRDEYEHEALRLRNELLRDRRLRACIKLQNGKPSSAAQFKSLATYVSGRFKEALQRKSDRSRRPSYTQAKQERGDENMREVMRRTIEEERREKN